MNDAGSQERPCGGRDQDFAARRALKFILLIGALSFFADFTYEGSRSILGPYLGSLGANAAIIGIVTGFGELAGYGLRLLSGPLADVTGRFWPAMIVGYLVQMTSVPTLALTHSWAAAAALVAAGFADYPIIAYHLSRDGVARGEWIAIFYSVAMAVSGTGSLVLGRLFDRWGFSVLIGLTVLSAAFAPLVFLGGLGVALAGAAIWGLGMGVHESIIPAAVAPMVRPERRASAFGLFTAGYGVFWFLGSAAIGILYDRSVYAAVAFCVLAELAAVPVFVWVGRRYKPHRPS